MITVFIRAGAGDYPTALRVQALYWQAVQVAEASPEPSEATLVTTEGAVITSVRFAGGQATVVSDAAFAAASKHVATAVSALLEQRRQRLRELEELL